MTDILEDHIKDARITPFSGVTAIQEVMSMSAGPARRLLKALVDTTVELPDDFIVARLAAAKLVDIEFKHRKESILEGIIDDGPVNPKLIKGREATSLLPFNLRDYQEAVRWAKSVADDYRPFEGEGDDGEPVKRGRKGGTFDKVKQYMLDNPETFDKANKADEVAKVISEKLDVPESTTVQYVYKCRRLRKQEEI